MLELKNINYIKDNKIILKDINIKFKSNSFIVITGPNGSGKSSLAKMIMGIDKPTSGNIILNNKDITNINITDRSKLGISYAFQNPVKFKGITVYDLIKLSLNRDINKRECCDIFSDVGLCIRDYIDREVDSTLSGGELKRIEIMTTMLKGPIIAIFDEPEAGIDLWSFQKLIDVFKNLRERTNSCIIVISHQEKILEIADEIILMNEGSIKKIGSKEELINSILVSKACCLEDI